MSDLPRIPAGMGYYFETRIKAGDAQNDTDPAPPPTLAFRDPSGIVITSGLAMGKTDDAGVALALGFWGYVYVTISNPTPKQYGVWQRKPSATSSGVGSAPDWEDAFILVPA